MGSVEALIHMVKADECQRSLATALAWHATQRRRDEVNHISSACRDTTVSHQLSHTLLVQFRFLLFALQLVAWGARQQGGQGAHTTTIQTRSEPLDPRTSLHSACWVFRALDASKNLSSTSFRSPSTASNSGLRSGSCQKTQTPDEREICLDGTRPHTQARAMRAPRART